MQFVTAMLIVAISTAHFYASVRLALLATAQFAQVRDKFPYSAIVCVCARAWALSCRVYCLEMC